MVLDDSIDSAVFSQRGIPKPGDVVAGKYLVEDCLGSGGMGAVLAATRMGDYLPVALKVMLDEEAKHEDSTKRFFREARVASAIDSPHVAKLLDLGRLDSGAPFMVLERLEGEALDVVIRDEAPLPMDVAVDYLLQACEGVAEAHARGVIHRDLKPSNLFRTRRPDGPPQVKVLDFGISKATVTLDPRTDGMSLTETAMTLGSPQYMSPEQLKSSKDVDARTDIWSLGLILHKLLAGRPAFEATTVGAHFAMILSEPPTRLRAHVPSAPPELERAILMCLMRDRDQRWQDVGQLAAALAPFGPPRSEQRAERVARILQQSGASSVSHPELVSVAHAPTIRDGPVREPVDGLLTDGNAPTSTWSPVARGQEPGGHRGWRLFALGAVALVVAGAFGAGRLFREEAALPSQVPAATTLAPVAPPTASTAASTVLDKQQLLDRVAKGSASESDLLMLQALCLRDGDEACRELAVAALAKLQTPSATSVPRPSTPPAGRAAPSPQPTKKPPIKPKGPLEETL